MLTDLLSHVLEFFGVVPNLVEQTEVGGRKGSPVHLVDKVGHRIAFLVSEIDSGEAVQGMFAVSVPPAHTQANCCMGALVRLLQNMALRRIQSAHSLAVAAG